MYFHTKIIKWSVLGLLVCSAQLHSYDLFFKPTKTGGWSLREDFLQDLARLFHADVFIESGTSYGGTTRVAKKIFKTVHTIELDEKFYKNVREKFFDDLNVFVYQGDSAAVLPKILSKMNNRQMLFWLDGHYSGGITAKGTSNTPVMQELQAIKDAGITDAVILVDDLSCFQPDMQEIPEVAQGYPTVAQLRDAIVSINPNYTFIIYGSIAIAYPSHYVIKVSPLIQAMTTSRLFDSSTMLYENVFASEGIIASQTTPDELEALWDMCTYHFGWHRAYPYLWYSLALFTAHRYGEAHDNLSIVLDSGYKDWRVSWYAAQAADRCGKDSDRFLNSLLNLAPSDFKAAGKFLEALAAK